MVLATGSFGFLVALLVRGCGAGGASKELPSSSTLTANNGDRIFLADSRNHRVCVFGVSPLRFLTSFGQRDSLPLRFKLPYGLAVHACCLYVADSGNKCVHVLTLHGQFLSSFDVDYRPYGIAVRPDGKLLVESDFGRRVELMTPFGSLLQVRPPHAYESQI